MFHLSRGERFESSDGDLVIGEDLIVVRWVAEGQRQKTLLLQVGFCGQTLCLSYTSYKLAYKESYER